MREYPRVVYKSETDYKIVFNGEQEVKAAGDGYESSHEKEVIARRKGTDREILRVLPNVDVTPEPVFDKPKRKRRTPAEMAEAKGK